MAIANYYEFNGQATRVRWYPEGTGGPLIAGKPPQGPVMVYNDGAINVIATGNELVIGPPTPAGRFVVASVKKNLVPGGTVSFGVLIPDVKVEGQAVPVQTLGVLAVHRGVAELGAGQLEHYTELNLNGTAASIILRD